MKTSPFVGLQSVSLTSALRSLTPEQMTANNYGFATVYALVSLAFGVLGLAELGSHFWRAAVFLAFGATLALTALAFFALARRGASIRPVTGG